jgi:hypothetical protein
VTHGRIMQKAKIEAITAELQDLIKLGRKLYFRLLLEEEKVPEDRIEQIERSCGEVNKFNRHFERFYSRAVPLIQVLCPERLDDFVKQYKDEKRKLVDASTYVISTPSLGFSICAATMIDQRP